MEESLDIGPQTPVSAVVGEGCCTHCHYNLHSQKILRDERLGLMVCRCPECGRFTAADVLEPRPARAGNLLYGSFVVAQTLGTIGIAGMLFLFSLAIQVNYLRLMRYRPTPARYAALESRTLVPEVTMLAMGALLGLVLALSVAGYGWRWPRFWRLLAGMIFPIIGVIAYYLCTSTPLRIGGVVPLEWSLICVVTIQILGYAAGEIFHRGILRWLLRIFLPMPLRRYLTHFWNSFDEFAQRAQAAATPVFEGGKK